MRTPTAGSSPWRRPGSRVYVGGKISKIRGKSRSRLAAVSAQGRLVKTWRPRPNGFVRTIAMSPDRKNVLIGGDFTRVGTKKQRHLAKLAVKKARVRSLKRHPAYPVVQIITTHHQLFLAGNGAGGHAASYDLRGRLRWVTQTDGAVHSIGLLDGALYVGGQFNNVCVGNTGGPTSGFDCPTVLAPRQHLTALAGSDGSVLPWDPGTDSIDGVFAVAPVADSVQIGGDFTTVHGAAQQGYGVFAALPPPPALTATEAP